MGWVKKISTKQPCTHNLPDRDLDKIQPGSLYRCDCECGQLMRFFRRQGGNGIEAHGWNRAPWYIRMLWWGAR